MYRKRDQRKKKNIKPLCQLHPSVNSPQYSSLSPLSKSSLSPLLVYGSSVRSGLDVNRSSCAGEERRRRLSGQLFCWDRYLTPKACNLFPSRLPTVHSVATTGSCVLGILHQTSFISLSRISEVTTSVVPVHTEFRHSRDRSTSATFIGIDSVDTEVCIEDSAVAMARASCTTGEDFHAVCCGGRSQGGDNCSDVESHICVEAEGYRFSRVANARSAIRASIVKKARK